MWKLCFLFTAWLANVQVKGSDVNFNLKPEMDAEFDRIAEEFLSSLTMAHTKTPSRRKRDVTSDIETHLVDNTGVYRFRSITPVNQLCHPAVYSKFLEIENMTYAICATVETPDTPAEVIVGLYEEHQWRPEWRWHTDNLNGLSAFHFNDYIYVLVADKGKKGIDLVRINIITKEKKVDHTTHSEFPASISIWKMKVDGTYHMAIANSFGYKDTTYNYEVYTYKWMDTYFHKYSAFRAYDVKDIEPFHIHGAAYLAIANFRRSQNDYQVDSEILKYNLDKKMWISHQKVRTYGAMDWEFFTLGHGLNQEFFLAVANKESNGISDIKTMVYKFVKDKFVPFQCLPTSSATSIAAWSQEPTFLLAVANLDGVHIYQYDGWKFVQASIQYTQGSMHNGVRHLVFQNIVRSSENALILSVSNPLALSDLSVYEIGLEYENFIQEWNEKSTSWCLNTLNHLESTSTDSAISLLDDVVFVDQITPITITGSLHFENGFGTEKLKTPFLKEIITQETYDSRMLLNLEDLQRRLQEISAKLDGFERVVQHSLQIEGNQTVYGHLKFQDVSFDCETQSCHFDSIKTTILNGEEIGDWGSNLVFLDGEQVINGTIRADKINANGIIVQGLIDGIDSRNLVTKSGDFDITGEKTFVNLLTANDIEVHGLVDGVEISPTNILLTTGHQKITGNLTFDDMETSWLEAGLVNGVNLPGFYGDVVRLDQPASIMGMKTFQDIIVDDLIMNPGATINGVDLVDLWANTLWTEGDQEIKAPMILQSMSVRKNLNVPAGINGIQIPGPRVVNIQDDYTKVTAPHFFESSIKMAQLNVLKSLNGLGTYTVPGKLPQLDIMLNTGDQVVTGKKTFHTINLDADSFVKGTVDGVDLSEFKAMVLHRDSSVNLNNTWTFNNLVIKGPLTVNKISGYDLGEIYDKALKLTDEEIPEITFTEAVTIEELESHDINGIDIERDLVLRNKPQTLTGNKVFRDIVLKDDSQVLGMVNNMSISFLTETILRIGNQVLKSKVFKGNVKMNKLTVTGSINSVPISEFVTLSGDEELLHSRELVNVTFSEIEANNIEVTGTVNNINVEEMMKDTLTYEGDEKVLGKKTVKGTIHIADGEDLTAHKINGININEVWDDAVLLDEPQEISGVKTFKESVTFDNLLFQESIDGVSEWDMNNWMLKDAPQVVKGNVIFSNGLSVKNLNVEGYINGIDITELDRSIVKINEPNTIEGPIVFDNLLVSNGDISLTGKIQDVDLSEEAVIRSGDQVVTGAKTFTQDLIVEGDATVDGLVDGVSIVDICQNTLLVRKEQNITHMTIKGDVTFLGGGTIGGKVAGIDLVELREIAVSTEDSELTFSGNKIFENLTIEGPVIIEGRFGGEDLKFLNETYMSLTRDQDITTRMEFEELKFEGTLLAKKFNTESKMVNDIDIGSLNRILRIDTPQTVTAAHHFDEIIFADDVFVAGKVNGLELPGGLMRHNKVNYIHSSKVFEKPVHVLGDLVMDEGKQIQGVDVSDWYKKAVLRDGGTYEIDGYKTFYNLSVNDARVKGLLDGLEISEQTLLMSYGDQVITGRKTIKGDVTVAGSLSVDGLVNGQDLNYLSTNTLQRGRVNTITGVKHFSQPLTIQNLQAPTVAGVDVLELEKKINTHLDFENLQSRLQELGGVLTNMQGAINKQAVLLQYYELFQEFDIPTAYSWLYISGKDCGEFLLLSDNSSSEAHCSSLRLFNYDQELQEFVAHPQELLTSYAVSVKSLFAWDATYLFVANQNSNRNPACLSGKNVANGNTTGDIYIWNGSLFERYQALEIPPIMHMVAFQDSKLCCVVYIELQNCEVYCSKGSGLKFELLESLQTKGGRKASLVQTRERTLLAIAAEDLVPRTDYVGDKKPVDIYLWHSDELTFGRPVQVILSTYAQSVLLMQYRNENSSYIFLVIAEGRIPRVQNEPKILIYRYDESSGQFQKYQEIKDYGELEWIVLKTGELILFALDSHVGKIKLYEHKGASGFVNVDTVNSIGSIGLHVFIRHEEQDSMNHYLALAGPRAPMVPSQGMDYAKILKSKVKGRSHFINV